MSDLTHFDGDGRPRMVDVSAKPSPSGSPSHAVSSRCRRRCWTGSRRRTIAKGDPIAIAELAGIMGAKRTADLIPLCHPIALDSVSGLDPRRAGRPVGRGDRARPAARTGVEMEAMTAVSVACLTLYDMLKGGGARTFRSNASSSGRKARRQIGDVDPRMIAARRGLRRSARRLWCRSAPRRVALGEAAGRILAVPVIARHDQPPARAVGDGRFRRSRRRCRRGRGAETDRRSAGRRAFRRPRRRRRMRRHRDRRSRPRRRGPGHHAGKCPAAMATR